MGRRAGSIRPLSLSSQERLLALAAERSAQACLRRRVRALSSLFRRETAMPLRQAADAALFACPDCRAAYRRHFDRMASSDAAALPLLRQMQHLIDDIQSVERAAR